jgi:hypothetical protein
LLISSDPCFLRSLAYFFGALSFIQTLFCH